MSKHWLAVSMMSFHDPAKKWQKGSDDTVKCQVIGAKNLEGAKECAKLFNNDTWLVVPLGRVKNMAYAKEEDSHGTMEVISEPSTEYQIYAYDKNGKLTHCGPHKISGEVTREKFLELEKEWVEWRKNEFQQSVVPSDMYYYHPIGQAQKMMGISLVNP
jgi:hypothetical protein